MKSEHRHELETNALAKHLDHWLIRIQPYLGTVVAIVAVVVAALVGWSLYSGSTSSRQTEAWNEYNEAVLGEVPDLEKLHESAQEFPGSTMKELADITWADGQVWLASRQYIYQRSEANEALDRAQSAYEGVLRTTSDENLLNRARLGLARVYELRGEVDKARAEYEKVQGGFATIAQLRAERLKNDDAKATYEWLASAQPPRPRAPLGGGTPGQIPDFSVGDFSLPSATGQAPAGGDGASLDTLFEGLNLQPAEGTPDRYETDVEEGAAETDATDAAATDESPADATGDTGADAPAPTGTGGEGAADPPPATGEGESDAAPGETETAE